MKLRCGYDSSHKEFKVEGIKMMGTFECSADGYIDTINEPQMCLLEEANETHHYICAICNCEARVIDG